MNIPIKKKLTILSVITITIPLLVLSLIFFMFAGKTIINESTDRTMEKMLLLDQALTLYMEKIKHTVNTIANNPIIYGLDTRELTTYKYNPEWTDMMPLHNSKNEKNIYEYLKLININNPDFGAVYVGTALGKFVMYPPSGRRPYYDPSKRPWYKEAKEKNGRTTITSPFQSSDTNFYVFAVAQYIYFINSQEYGVVSANIELSTLTRILNDLDIGNNYVILTTKDNIILANTKVPESNFKSLDSPDMPDYFHDLINIDRWTQINTGENVYLANRIHSEGTGWYLYTLIDKSKVVAPFRKVFLLMIAIAVLILTVFTPFAVKFSIDSLVPLKKLSDHLLAVAMGNGNLQKKIPLYSSDEIGTTIENFNLFSESLNNMFIKIIDAQQSISSNNSTFSNQMLMASADISKNISSLDNIEKEIHHAETCINNSLKISEEIEQACAAKNDKSKDLNKYAGIIKMEMEQLASYFRSLVSYVYDIKNTTSDINNCIDTTTEYCKSNKDELIAIGKLLSVYKLKNTETKLPDKSRDHPGDKDNKGRN
ncbi:MAG: methyl-accepting chemotaxis protein [Spirochaetia bacterium]|jgi:methyl-accepting chemotaxis protein|nr:methyl-accepting chemotaxis protein [Spirochaetia bacterium]